MKKTNFLILAAVLLYLNMSCLAMNTILNITTDQSALLALSSHITFGPNNMLVNNWSTNSSVCHWIGVTCSSHHQRVTALNISNMGLLGSIPPHIGNLSFLVSLDISTNSFRGQLPKELAHLRRLNFINFSFNNFTGGFPSWFAALPKLQHLLLDNNSFSGSIPSSLSNISMLETLYLRFNLFEGNIPQEIGNLRNIKSLSMGYNRFTGSIPASIFNISSMESISFTNNGLSGSLPVNMCHYLQKLALLVLSSNELYGEIPRNLSGCSEIQILALSDNKFSGSIPREIGNLTMLKDLYLENNNFKGELPQEMGNLLSLELLAMNAVGLTGPIPSSLYNITSLKWLYLYGNNLSGSLPWDVCLHFPVLVGLYLGNNKFTGTIPREIGNCTSLVELYLDINNLTGVIPEEIGNLLNLEVLILGSNSLEGTIPENIFNISTVRVLQLRDNHLSGNLPPSFGHGLPNLEALYLGQNIFSGIIPNSISNASKLAHLSLIGNKFTGSIPNSLGNLELLDFFSLAENNFIVTESSSPELSFLTSLTNCRLLRVLWINNNSFNGYLPVSIGNLSSSLETIDASFSRIKGYIPGEMGNLSSLASLYIDGNDLIGYIPKTIRGLRKLQVLSLRDNRISSPIPNDICHLLNLGELSLSKNKLFGPVPDCLGNTTSLRYLSLDSNELTSSIPPNLWSLNDLLHFNLSSNALSGHLSPEIGNLKVAILIDLSMNQFSGDIPITIGGLQNLINLSLASNRLQGPIPESFGNMLSLVELDLSHNNLSGAIPKSLEKLLHLKYLNVSFNGLKGEIPSGGPFANFTSQSFKSNEALCGSPHLQLPPCHTSSSNGARTKRVLLFVFISLAVATTIVTLTIAFVLTRRKRRTKIPSQTDLPLGITYERISYHELRQATDGFNESNLLGMGSFGSVYKGILSNGMILAIKVFNLQLESAFKSFDTECEVLRNLRHRNLTKVISSCSNLDFKALVLEYMPNGSLEKWLYSLNYFLDILQRLDIMIDVACALDYLHHGYSTPVVHCDLKPSNVLLDEDMVAHLSDFGIAKLLGEGDSVTQTTTLATIGYIAPEYGLEGSVSTKADVYSYGIMLMEVFTRTKPSDERFTGDLSLKRWVNDSLSKSILEVMDSNLLRPEQEHFTIKVQCVSSIMELALSCSVESPEERISMKDVQAALKKIRVQYVANHERNLETGKFLSDGNSSASNYPYLVQEKRKEKVVDCSLTGE